MVEHTIDTEWHFPYNTTITKDDAFVQVNVGNCSSVTGTHGVKSQRSNLVCGFQNFHPYGNPQKFIWSGEISSTNSNIVQLYLRTSLQPTAVVRSTGQSMNPGDTLKWKIKITIGPLPKIEPNYIEQLYKLNSNSSHVYIPKRRR